MKRIVDAQATEVKRKEIADRIEANLKAAREKEEDKRTGLLRKQGRHEELMSQIYEEKQAELEHRQEMNEAIERKRQHQLKLTRDKDDAIKQDIRTRIEQEEANLIHLAEQRRKEQMLLKAEKDLQMQMKRENLKRIKRKQEYQLKETMRKVEENDRRTQELKKRKEELLKLRRKNAHEAKVTKDKLMAVLEQSKSGGGLSAIRRCWRRFQPMI